jgi:hypothetical protein
VTTRTSLIAWMFLARAAGTRKLIEKRRRGESVEHAGRGSRNRNLR